MCGCGEAGVVVGGGVERIDEGGGDGMWCEGGMSGFWWIRCSMFRLKGGVCGIVII